MEKFVVGWLLDSIKNYICELVDIGKANIITKIKLRLFFKDLDKKIHDYCDRNECLYLNSSAFQYFISYSQFTKKVISMAVSTKIEKSRNTFIRELIKEARSIAESEGVAFGHNEERVIKDLYKVINEASHTFFSKTLSMSQKYEIATLLNSNEELKEIISDSKNDSNMKFESIQNSIKDLSRIPESKAIIIAEMIFKSVWDADFDNIDRIRLLIEGRSNDLQLLINVILYVFDSDQVKNISEEIRKIQSNIIKDLAIRTVLPVLIFNEQEYAELRDAAYAPSLCSIITLLNEKQYSVLYGEKIENDTGIEIHSYTLDKTLICEEEWILKYTFLLYLYRLPIANVAKYMEEIVQDNENWFSKLLIADRFIDMINNESYDSELINNIKTIIKDIQKFQNFISLRNKNIKILFFSIMLKYEFLYRSNSTFIDSIPADIKECDPVNAFMLMDRIERQEVNENEVLLFVEKTKNYWVLNNYFVSKKDPEGLIAFCKQREDIFVDNPVLFFMFIGALRRVGDDKARRKWLKKYKNEFVLYYEFWNEFFDYEELSNQKSEFIQICKEGKIKTLYPYSEIMLCERLLQMSEYETVVPYIKRLELKGLEEYRVKKYKAIIEQSKGNQVEALKMFKELFEGKCDDVYVVDSIITISLMNNRKIEEKYIDVAEKIGTSRMQMLAAAAYKSIGKDARAKVAYKKSILLTKDEYNPAYGQYVAFDLSDKSEVMQNISSFEENTYVECINQRGETLKICIDNDRVLPYCPYYWHGDIHMYIDEAARRGYLRKHKEDKIEVDGEEYLIVSIKPLDVYYVQTCFENMQKSGVAWTINIEVKDGKSDFDKFTEWIIANTPDEKNSQEWIKQYNNLSDVPMPLFMYKGFSRASYLQFVDIIFSDKNIFIRESKSFEQSMFSGKRYVFSFAAIVALYKVGFPIEIIIKNNGVVTSSTIVQVDTDAERIIEEYDRDTVASMGVVDGKIFYNQTNEDGKDYWIKEAGKLKKYINAIPQIENTVDLQGEFQEQIDEKTIMGICDYDSIALAQSDDEYVVVTLEAMLDFMLLNNNMSTKGIRLIDWIVGTDISTKELIKYLRKLMEIGCLYSVSKSVLRAISEKIERLSDDEKNEIYVDWNHFLHSLDTMSESMKIIAIQSIAEEVTGLERENVKIDRGVLNILTQNILLLKRQKLEITIDREGQIRTILRNMTKEEVNNALIELSAGI